MRSSLCIGFLLLLAAACLAACSRAHSNTPAAETERLTKTVFTEKLGAYLVYAPLKVGQPSNFALHLTDLAEGTPVGGAEITLNARAKSTQAATQFKAAASDTTGVYIAQVSLPKAGEYYIECEIKHTKFSGRLTLTDFDVE